MRFPTRLARAALAAAALALPLKAAGCTGSTACIDVPEASYATKGCPTKSAAGTFFAGACAVASVDGEGSYDGEFCCYPVTQIGGEVDCGGVPAGVNGVGGGPSTVGVSGTGGFGTDVATSSGVGVFTDAGQGCVSCSQAVAGMQFPVSVCGGAAGAAFMAVVSCACSACAMQCTTSICAMVGPASSDCVNCATTSCNAEISACLSN
jgi:hypothetical protein